MPIVNPDEEIRQGYSVLSHLAHKHQDQGKPRVEIIRQGSAKAPPICPDHNQNLEELLSDEQLDITLIENYSVDMPQTPVKTQSNRYTVDTKGNLQSPSGSGNFTTSSTHFHSIDIEQNSEQIAIVDDSLVEITLSATGGNPKTKETSKSRDVGQGDHRLLTNTRDPLEGAEYDWACMPRKQYRVGTNLRSDSRVQAMFFAKIMLIKALQLAIINLWIFIVGLIPPLRNETIRLHNWFLLSLGLFIGLMVAIRLIAHTRSNWHPATTTVSLIAVTICIAYALASVTYKYEVFAIPTVTWILMLTCLLLTLIPYLIQVPITDPSMLRTGGVITVLVSILMLIISVYTTADDVDVTDFAYYIWLPSLLLSELVLWVMLCEIQRVIQGWSFHVSERRWFFASLYV